MRAYLPLWLYLELSAWRGRRRRRDSRPWPPLAGHAQPRDA